MVSIHAPARGATWQIFRLVCLGDCFNPRTRTGCDQETSGQSDTGKGVSIHAPARGATIIEDALPVIIPKFQSTHPHGVRRDYFPR